jgi:hypothetical protein
MKLSDNLPKCLILAVLAAGFGVFVLQLQAPSGMSQGPTVDVKVPALSMLAIDGKTAFDANCATCHGLNAAGTTSTIRDIMLMGPFFSRPSWVFGNTTGLTATCRRCVRSPSRRLRRSCNTYVNSKSQTVSDIGRIACRHQSGELAVACGIDDGGAVAADIVTQMVRAAPRRGRSSERSRVALCPTRDCERQQGRSAGEDRGIYGRDWSIWNIIGSKDLLAA